MWHGHGGPAQKPGGGLRPHLVVRYPIATFPALSCPPRPDPQLRKILWQLSSPEKSAVHCTCLLRCQIAGMPGPAILPRSAG